MFSAFTHKAYSCCFFLSGDIDAVYIFLDGDLGKSFLQDGTETLEVFRLLLPKYNFGPIYDVQCCKLIEMSGRL